MVAPSLGARFAGALSVALLVGGTFVQAAPILASNPGHVLNPTHASPSASSLHPVAVHLGSRGTINVAALLAHPAAGLPFNPVEASATLGRLEAKARAARKAAPARTGAGPAIIGPPPPNLATTSGEPAAATPVAVAGQTVVSAGGFEPPDPGIGVGPDGYIQTDNISFLFGDRAASVALKSVKMPVFFNLPPLSAGFTTFDSDPRVHFDTLRQRWIASEVSWDCATYMLGTTTPVFGHGFVDFAISDTADALGTWQTAYFESDDALPDQPSFGTSTDKLAFTDSSFAMGAGGSTSTPGCASGAALGSELRMMDWAELVPGFLATNVHGSDTPFPLVSDLRAAIQEPVSSPAIRLIGSTNGSTATDVYYLEVTGSVVLGTITSVNYDLTSDSVVPEFQDPPSPRQPGPGVLTNAIDGRPDSVIFQADKLAFTSTYPCIPATDTIVRDCIRIVTLANQDPTLEPIRLGDALLGTNANDVSYGGIAWAGSGILHAVYTQSSLTSDGSSYARYNLPTDAPTLWSTPQLLTLGMSTYTGARWGDYTIVAPDPQNPNAVWAGDQSAGATGGWATTIHQLVVGNGAGYFPIPPVRVLSSRDSIGLAGYFMANLPRTLPLAGTNGIPLGTVAITANLTVTGQNAAGYISLTPTPTVNPSSSTLNFPLGDTRANNTTIALGADGSLSAVYKAVAGRHANVILDVTGYFLNGSGQNYFPLSPIRILDSRYSLGAFTFHANVPQAFPVRNTLTIPSDATAITANLTVAGQTKPGYVAITVDPTASPTTSTLNFPLGDNRANGLTIPIAANGSVAAVYKAASGTASLILDVTGYYSNTGGGLLFHPLNPGRRVDTRTPLGKFGYYNGLTGAQGTASRQVTIADHFGVPIGASAITGNLTITGQTGPGFVAVTDKSVAKPTTSTINFPLGDTRANGITAPLGAGLVWLIYQSRVGKTVHLILDITGYFQ